MGKLNRVRIAEITLAIVAIIISLVSAIIAWDVAHGDANLELKYALRDVGVFYYYQTNEYGKQDVAIQFIVQNTGFGSTVYTVDALTCLNPPHCLPEDIELPGIRYNDQKSYNRMSGPDFHTINPKSSDLVEVIYYNISADDLPDSFEVRVQDYVSGKELWMAFGKSPVSRDFIRNLLES